MNVNNINKEIARNTASESNVFPTLERERNIHINERKVQLYSIKSSNNFKYMPSLKKLV